jgi:SnoaL-like domain
VSSTSEVADRQELRELVERYAQNADRRNRPAFGSLFTSDGVMSVPFNGETAVPGGLEVRGREAISDLLLELDKTYTRTMHFVGNHMVMFIRYHDTYVRTAEGWRIARRELGIDWQEDRPTRV